MSDPRGPLTPGPVAHDGGDDLAVPASDSTDHHADEQPTDQLDRLRRELEAERAGAAHWRDVARRREHALGQLKGRTSVRAVLALERHTAGARHQARETAREVREAAGRLGLAATAAPTRRRLPERRRRLDAAVAAAARPGAAAGTGRRALVLVVGATDRPAWADALPAARVHVRLVPDPAAVAATIAESESDLVCLVAGDVEPLTPTWLDHLDRALTAPPPGSDAPAVGVATGVLVHPARPAGRATPHDLLVRAAGYQVTAAAPGVPRVEAALAGTDPATVADGPVTLAGAGLIAVERRSLEAAGGYRPLGDPDAAVVDLCLRLRARGLGVARVGAALALDHRDVVDRHALRRPFDETGPVWAGLLASSGPALWRAGPAGAEAPTSFTITVAAPTPKVAERWGDWHLAQGLARSLGALGHPATVRTLAESTEPAALAADVHVVLRGLAPVPRTAGRVHVLWVISHPEDLDPWEWEDADLVVVASRAFAEDLRTRTATPVEVLLQATDAHRFRPLPADPAHRHTVTVVGKSRDVLRPMVADALAAGLRPAIYGSGWEHLVDPSLVVTDHVDNADLPRVYASATVVLNDHWDTMRAWGFISNRVFDVLACGTPLVSDPLPELTELFGDLVPTWRDPDELAAAVRAAHTDPHARERVARARDLVLAAHTFDHRAGELLDHLRRHSRPVIGT